MNDPKFLATKSNPYMADIVKTYGDCVVSTMYPGREANLPQNTLDAERWWRDTCQAVLMGDESNEQILANMQKKTEDLIADLGF